MESLHQKLNPKLLLLGLSFEVRQQGQQLSTDDNCPSLFLGFF